MSEKNKNEFAMEMLIKRVAQLEARERERAAVGAQWTKAHRRLARWIGIGAAAILLAAVTVSAEPSVSLICPDGELYCFEENTPTLASEVNHNFAQLKTWLEAKVGVAESPGVSTTMEININGKAFGGITIGSEIMAEQYGGPATKTAALGAADGRRVCFLTYQYHWNGDNGSTSAFYNLCEIRSASGQWYLDAHTNNTGGAWANTRCKARCISW